MTDFSEPFELRFDCIGACNEAVELEKTLGLYDGSCHHGTESMVILRHNKFIGPFIAPPLLPLNRSLLRLDRDSLRQLLLVARAFQDVAARENCQTGVDERWSEERNIPSPNERYYDRIESIIDYEYALSYTAQFLLTVCVFMVEEEALELETGELIQLGLDRLRDSPVFSMTVDKEIVLELKELFPTLDI